MKDKYIYVKTDPITLTSKDIGFYLVNINLNDISVMGGIPLYFLCVLLPENIFFSEVENIFSQISSECKKFGIKWIGGHTEIIPDIKNSIRNPGISVYKEAKILWENFKIKWMHDPTEGGISTALYEISESKNIGILVDLKKLKFYPATLKFCKIFGLNPLGIISSGCIIGIIDRKDEKKLVEFCKKNKIKLEIIGEVMKEKGVYYIKDNKKYKFPKLNRDEINRLVTGKII